MSLEPSPLEFFPYELLVAYCNSSSADNPSYAKALDAMNSYKALSCISRRVHVTMCSLLSQGLFVNILGPKYFCREAHPLGRRGWQFFLNDGFRLLTNWSKDLPSFTHDLLNPRQYQAFKGDDGAELFGYDKAQKMIVRKQVGASSPEEVLDLHVELKAPGKYCHTFIAYSKKIWAVNEGENSVSIFCKETRKLLCRLDNLGQVLQLEMIDDYLYILVQGKEHTNDLLRYDMSDPKALTNLPHVPAKLSLPSHKVIARFFFFKNKINFQENEGVRFRLWSLALSPAEAFQGHQGNLKWVVSKFFSSSSMIVRAEEDFIICRNQDLNLQRLSVNDKEFVTEELVDDISHNLPTLKISNLYYLCGKLFIFFFTAEYYNLITYDCVSKKIGSIEKFPYLVKSKDKNSTLVFHSSAGKVNFIYQHSKLTERDELTASIATIDYSKHKHKVKI